MPIRLKVVARLLLVHLAMVVPRLRSIFKLALPRDIEFRHAVDGSYGVQRSKDDNRQVNQHVVLHAVRCIQPPASNRRSP